MGRRSPSNRTNITLDPDLRDAWGLPAIRVTYRDYPDELAFRAGEHLARLAKRGEI
ncbi:MAG: hypothetical protein ABIX28_05035 [Vicinamibacterales bacterium]